MSAALTAADARDVVPSMRAGETLVYHRGFLACDRESPRIAQLAGEIWRIAVALDLGALVQKRIGEERYEYWFIRNCRKAGPALSKPKRSMPASDFRLPPETLSTIDALARKGERVAAIASAAGVSAATVKRRMRAIGAPLPPVNQCLLSEADFAEFLRLAAKGRPAAEVARRVGLNTQQVYGLMSNHRHRIEAVRAGADPVEVARGCRGGSRVER
jgi:DNA-binding phage protein